MIINSSSSIVDRLLDLNIAFFPCATVVFEFRVICFWVVQRWNLNSQTLFDLLVLSRIEWF